MKKPKFNIGDYVEAISSTIEYENVDLEYWDRPAKRERKIIVKSPYKPKRGVIIGAVIRYTGTLDMPSYYSGESPVWIAEKGVLFWQIREGFLNKPFEALEEDIKLIERVHFHCIRLGNSKGKDINNPVKIPWKNTGWTDYYRKAQSEDMKSL